MVALANDLDDNWQSDMASAGFQRVHKLQEFVSHSSNISCARIARKTPGVFATGGSDHKVNIWSLGKLEPVLTLAGHSSPVECLTLDPKEEDVLIAGGASGSIKLWDLQEAKVVRTVSGHKVSCISLDFHPFGDFFASGSLDASLKVWDIRRKDCIHTYKDHAGAVKCLKFSPDGRWVVSGGDDGVVKLWDLTAGKLMHDFKSRDGQILCLDFHPHEFLLASGSSGGISKFYDLETFELVGAAAREASEIRGLGFTPDGRTLLSASGEAMKVWGWEPIRSFDTVPLPWGKHVGDMAIQDSRLVSCSLGQFSAELWAVDLSRVAPFAPDATLQPVSPRASAAASASPLKAQTSRSPDKDSPTTSDETVRSGKLAYTGLKVRNLRSGDRPTYSSAVEITSSPSSRCRRPTCVKANLLHHSGSCEMAPVEAPPPQPLTSSNAKTPPVLKANFTTTTVSSRQKSTPSRTPAGGDAFQPGSAKASRLRRVSVGPADLGRAPRENATPSLEPGTPTEKRTTRHNRRASLGNLSTNGASRSTHPSSSSSDIPVAYIMSMERTPPPTPPASAPGTPLYTFGNGKGSRRTGQPNLSEPGLEPRVDEIVVFQNHSSTRVEAGPLPARAPRADGTSAVGLNAPFALDQVDGTAGERTRTSFSHGTMDQGSGVATDKGGWGEAAAASLGQRMSSVGAPSQQEDTSVNTRGSPEGSTGAPSSSRSSAPRPAADTPMSLPSVVHSLSTTTETAPVGIGDSASSLGGEGVERQSGDMLKPAVTNGYGIPKTLEAGKATAAALGRRTELLSAHARSDEGLELSPAPRNANPQPSAPLGPRVPESSSEGRGEATNGALPQGSAPRRGGTRSPPSAGAKPLGLNMAAFLPGSQRGGLGDVEEAVQDDARDEETIEELLAQHHTMGTILQARLTNVQVVKTFWVKDDVKGAVEAMEKMADSSVVVDVLSILATRSGGFTLEICSLLLPLLEDLLSSPHDRYISTGLSVLRELLKNFGDIICSTRAARPAPGVDVEAEQRRERCDSCYDGFQALSQHLGALVRNGGVAGKDANELYSTIRKL